MIGFHVQETWEHEGEVGGAALIAGLGPLFLVQDDFAKGRDRDKGVGVRIHMTTAHDVDDLAAAIEGRGGTLDSAVRVHQAEGACSPRRVLRGDYSRRPYHDSRRGLARRV